jgi:hypothetical protein
MGDFQSAVDMLESHDRAKGGSVLDRMAGTEMKGVTTCRLCLEEISFFTARLLAKLKETNADDEQKTAWTERADAAWRWLLSQNADGYEYYKGFLANQGIDLGGCHCLTLSSGVLTVSQLTLLTKIGKRRLKCSAATSMSSLLPLRIDWLFMWPLDRNSRISSNLT